MKKLAAFVAVAALASTPAAADDLFFKPYVGADYQYSKVSYDDGGDDIVDDTLHGGNFHAGAKIHKNFGLEAGYFRTQEGSKNDVLGSGINTGVRFSGFTLDALGYLPVAQDIELIGMVGVGRIKGELDVSGLLAVSGSEWETKPRAGAGAQYSFSPDWNVRAMVVYQDADFDGTVNHLLSGQVGVNYAF